MGRGIIESGLFRSERYQLERRTSDPATTQEGEMWIRTDLAPDADQLATLRFDNGSGTWDIPIYDTTATTDNVSKALRFEVAGSTGFVPVTTSGGAYDALRLQHNDSTYAFHDALEAPAIPDSAVNRWPTDEGSGSTIADSIGSNDGTINDATWTSGTWIGDYALSLDGIDDYLSFATVPVIDTSTEFAVSVTVEIPILSFSGQRNIMHQQTGNSNRFAISADGDNDFINVGLFDGSSFVGLASGGVSTGQKVRIVYNYDGAGNGELYLNTTEQTGTNTPSTIAGATGFEMGRRLDGEKYLQFDIDEPIIYDTQLTSTQVQDDYNRQPWS